MKKNILWIFFLVFLVIHVQITSSSWSLLTKKHASMNLIIKKSHLSYDQIQNFSWFATLQTPENAVECLQFIIEGSQTMAKEIFTFRKVITTQWAKTLKNHKVGLKWYHILFRAEIRVFTFINYLGTPKKIFRSKNVHLRPISCVFWW